MLLKRVLRVTLMLFNICYAECLCQQEVVHVGAADWAFQNQSTALDKSLNPDKLKRKYYEWRIGAEQRKRIIKPWCIPGNLCRFHPCPCFCSYQQYLNIASKLWIYNFDLVMCCSWSTWSHISKLEKKKCHREGSTCGEGWQGGVCERRLRGVIITRGTGLMSTPQHQ